jgi:hypothetical protein
LNSFQVRFDGRVVSRRAGELDRFAQGVLEQDLAAAPPRDDVVREAGPALAQRLDLALEVGDLDLDAIPAPGLGSGPHLDVEAELLDVEVNCGVDVVGGVANADRGFRSF